MLLSDNVPAKKNEQAPKVMKNNWAQGLFISSDEEDYVPEEKACDKEEPVVVPVSTNCAPSKVKEEEDMPKWL